ncbi:hypothetical protein BDN70DRAFT_879311, partial [Pholiota conissans]
MASLSTTMKSRLESRRSTVSILQISKTSPINFQKAQNYQTGCAEKACPRLASRTTCLIKVSEVR